MHHGASSSAMVDSDGSTMVPPKMFTNKKVNVVLVEGNFLLWKQRVLLVVRSHRLEKMLYGSVQPLPSTITLDNGNVVDNEEYEVFEAQDSALASWELSESAPARGCYRQSDCRYFLNWLGQRRQPTFGNRLAQIKDNGFVNSANASKNMPTANVSPYNAPLANPACFYTNHAQLRSAGVLYRFCANPFWELTGPDRPPGHGSTGRTSRRFHYTDLLSATDDFSSDNFLGRGSHGSVYRAFLDNGKLIAAVKRTKANCNSPADNEIEILSRVYHPHLVNLIGYTSDTFCRNKLIVVEYMPNGSLFDLLHSSSVRPPGWSRRVRFALQVAKAVQALHSANPPVIHRDIKSSNVLIDRNWNARLGDFGLALRGHVEDVRVKCTPPAGTLGYLDPGYLASSDVSTKSDVFSYGILLLEIISGRYAIDLNYSPPSIVDWAVPLIKGGDFAAICDGRIGQPGDKELMRSLAVLAARCVRSTTEKRPGMTEVVECLKQLVKNQVFEGSEEAARSSRCGSKRNSRKVSSVDHNSEAIDDRTVGYRSRSMGTFAEVAMMMKKKKGATDVVDEDDVVRLRKTTGVKVKLSKSRSMGVVQTPRLTNEKNRKYVVEMGKRRISNESDVWKLVMSLDIDESKMAEKPLVGSG
ncbi:Serine/threonine-protein kinase-like protein [Hibiscus syriacus]|uniref:Serine/threonine-protein kinase-like protein n=1 Tax=Hibiscus syriacus TaxID=106335 RepID=A0A6A2XQF2_HIBSY|nr:Serine/threonine-protein kinase-like protein [Hibiscus syriacus]